MKTAYKFIHFEPTSNDDNDRAWSCHNNNSNDVLGLVVRYPRWRQYVFSQADEGIVFSADCLRDIVDFLEQANKLT